MTWVMVDVEADSPCPSLYSLLSFGAVIVEPKLEQTFYGRCYPIGKLYQEEALQISGHTRNDTLKFPDLRQTMEQFETWIKQNCVKPYMFISDNNGFDWQFINFYCWLYLGYNPFGHSSTNLGSLYKGMVKDFFRSFKHLRKTAHTHFPVDDAKGNSKALLAMKEMGLKIRL